MVIQWQLRIPIALFALAGNAVGQPTLTNLGELSGQTEVTGISGTGLTVVGVSGIGFRWTLTHGMTPLGPLLGDVATEANGVSADGLVVVGRSISAASGALACLWPAGSDPIGLGTLPGGTRSVAHGASADGSVVVGYSSVTGGTTHAFRWTLAGMNDLGTLAGDTNSVAYATNADGTIIVGSSSPSSRAVRWVYPEPAQVLAPLPSHTPGQNFSDALGISGNGAVVVGWATAGSAVRPVRWLAKGAQDLGVIACGEVSMATGVSADGTAIVGRSIAAGVERAWLWTDARGIVDLQSFLLSLGTNLGGWDLRRADAISADGTTIVGMGRLNGQFGSWIVTGLPAPDCFANCDNSSMSPRLTSNDFQCFLDLFAASDPRANCDRSTECPTLTANDFQCFINAFAGGCGG